ncbi:MAG: 1-(5-phosphoribosyl)-5-amino-4-imidazole-carboxylate carboxylase [Anaerophaga sp.]|uniref:nickel pincer cofactor biosynthesis protein LarB n=1 Tax=Anaerophaga thermohalophila TaxID=177400 RepID=UPI000237C6E2|nr:nickel pincer cofactor biosynthesis protein LarB [Anaerophaga thermohalophila]MBZ4675702.1 1-(5-phosphoribosyl)-5-amino-4-imidazole-carboxylate carboxylase [Anaerophaga sp.]MDN5292694.1 pyridinium-3,5-biscarboxylic acid mononucleotide synthase [Anaerophaga sp.]
MTFDELYEQIAAGKMSKDEARRHFSLEWMETARNYIADVNRGARINIPEIIYGEYKTADQTIELAEALLTRHSGVLVSRSPHQPALVNYFNDRYSVKETALLLAIGDFPEPRGHVLVISAGAADHPVASECSLALEALGVHPVVFEDRGIAHPTRVLDAVMEGLNKKVAAVIVVAGMEGALAPFVSSLVPLPVVGVPTSVGYGFRANEAALTSMLASCAPNLTVVNIDGGIRAAVVAGLIAKNSSL